MKAFKVATLPLCLAVLSGCLDSGSSGTPSPKAVARLSSSTFDIGTDTDISLDGSSSEARNGALISHRWSLASAPDGSQAEPADSQAIQTRFIPDLPGDYSLCLTVTDEKKTSAPACETLSVTNSVPLALLGDNTVVLVGQQYQLDASRSLPPTGGDANLLSYQWTLENTPDGNTAVLDDATYVMPRFTPNVEGSYDLSLVVSYEGQNSTKATTQVVASKVNGLPIANPGTRMENQMLGQRITLDGSASYDPDGDNLQYRWGFGYSPDTTQRPNGSKAVLDNADTASPSFVPDVLGTYNLWLQVYDGTSKSSNSSVQVVVDQLPAGHVNTKPVAVISPSFGATFEIELGASNSPNASYSWDVETATLTSASREWTFISGPAGFDQDTNWKPGAWPSIVSTHTGNYTIQLRVFDGELWSDPVRQVYTALTGANRPPRALPKLARVGGGIAVGATVLLDGEGSTDPDNNRLTYAWTLVDRPDGSAATLTNATSAFPSFVADKAGPYTAQLVVTDSHGFSSDPARLHVLAKAYNNAPIARARMVGNQFDVRQPLAIYPIVEPELTQWQPSPPYNASFNLVADAFDPDGDSVSHLWTMIGEPSGSRLTSPVQRDGAMFGLCAPQEYRQEYGDDLEGMYAALIALRDWTCADMNIAPTVAGTYRMQLLISDGLDIAGPYVFNIPAVLRANYPSLLLEHTSSIQQSSGNQQSIVNSARQKTLPLNEEMLASHSLSNLFMQASESYDIRTYTLTAFDKDYTLVNLEALSTGISADTGYTASFEGISEGQVIRKGQSQTFRLRLTAPANLPSGSNSTNLGAGLSWSFDIAEQAGWSFHFAPYIR